MQKLLVICGATATGKTAIGVQLAKKFDGEILSADSRQVYKGLDCIAGKDIKKGQKPRVINDLITYSIENISLWLYDLVKVYEECSVSVYARAAKKAIEIISQRNNKLPIVVGGTGLYISSIIKSIDTIDVPRNTALRTELENKDVDMLRMRLKEIDSQKYTSMNHSDLYNPRRLIRAIEVGLWKVTHNLYKSVEPSFDVLYIGLKSDEASQRERIRLRVIERMNSCAVQEAERLVFSIDEQMPSYSTLGLSHLFSYLHGDLTKEQVIDLWTKDECAYAKRQETWFRKEKDIVWFDTSNSSFKDSIEKLVGEWYTKK